MVIFVVNAFLDKIVKFSKNLGIGSLKDYNTNGFIIYHKNPEKMTINDIIVVTASNMPVQHVYPQPIIPIFYSP